MTKEEIVLIDPHSNRLLHSAPELEQKIEELNNLLRQLLAMLYFMKEEKEKTK